MKTRTASLSIYLTLSLLATPGVASAIELTFGGNIQTDVRFRVQDKSLGGYWNPLRLSTGVERNQNQASFRLGATAGRFAGVADLDFVWDPYYANVQTMTDLTRYDQVSSYYIRAKAAYLEATDLLPGLDLRIGQMVVNWGVGDQFNPTNNLNPNDVEDPLYFGRQLANLMVKADYSFKQDWQISGVLVPVFKPAILPRSAPLGLAANDRLPFTDAALRYRIHGESALTERLLSEGGLAHMRFPTVVSQAIPVEPETSASNMQFAFRLAGKLVEQDVALSYYVGRTDMPQPYLNYTSMKRGQICNPVNTSQCVDGVLSTETSLGFPRIQVLGFNMAGQMGWVQKLWQRIKPIGYRFELGVYFPQETTMTLIQDRLDFGPIVKAAGEYDYVQGQKPSERSGSRPTTVTSTPFAKWVLGLDYTFSRFVYMNAMWLHGMVDEFGAGDFFHDGVAVRQGGVVVPAGSNPVYDIGFSQKYSPYAREITRPRLGDYLVLGVDLKFLDDRGLLRLFTIWDLSGYTEDRWDPTAQARVKKSHSLFSKEGFSAVIYPELSYNFLNGLEVGAGAILMLGKDYTKFGDPAAGGSLVFTRARYSY